MWAEPTPDFVPHPWFRGPHRQTIAAAYLWRRLPYRAQQRTVTLADGDRLILHEDLPSRTDVSDRVVLLVHGLAGCHASGYMMRIAHKLAQVGFRVFRLDMRGCGAGWSQARRSLHAGRVDDLCSAAAFINQLSPGSPISLVGFSLGASLVLKMLGTRDVASWGLDSAVAVAPPLDLLACSRNLSRGRNRIYDRSFVRALCRIVDRRRQSVPGLDDVSWSRSPRSLYEFDARFTAPLGGFADVEDYYRRCSSLPDLPQIEVRTRILFAEDDPLVPADVYQRAQFAAQTRVYAANAGGHLGFLARPRHERPDADWHWMDWRIVDWIRDFDLEGPGGPRVNADDERESADPI